MTRRLIDLTGQRFGRWTALSQGTEKGTWNCRCDCGTVRIVGETNLRRHRRPSRSCGCLCHDIHSSHKLSAHPLYGTWRQMNLRCSPKCHKTCIHRYYDRGIRVCDAWKDDPTSFINWAEDMGWCREISKTTR